MVHEGPKGHAARVMSCNTVEMESLQQFVDCTMSRDEYGLRKPCFPGPRKTALEGTSSMMRGWSTIHSYGVNTMIESTKPIRH